MTTAQPYGTPPRCAVCGEVATFQINKVSGNWNAPNDFEWRCHLHGLSGQLSRLSYSIPGHKEDCPNCARLWRGNSVTTREERLAKIAELNVSKVVQEEVFLAYELSAMLTETLAELDDQAGIIVELRGALRAREWVQQSFVHPHLAFHCLNCKAIPDKGHAVGCPIPALLGES